jgi:hypothetical protein
VDRKGFTPYHSKMMKDGSVRVIVHRDAERATPISVAIAILRALAEAAVVHGEFRGDVTKASGLNSSVKEALEAIGFKHQHPKTLEIGGEVTNLNNIGPGTALTKAIKQALDQAGTMPDSEGIYLGKPGRKRGASQRGSKFYSIRCSSTGCYPGSTGKGKPLQYGADFLPSLWPGEAALKAAGRWDCPKHGATVTLTATATTTRVTEADKTAAILAQPGLATVETDEYTDEQLTAELEAALLEATDAPQAADSTSH